MTTRTLAAASGAFIAFAALAGASGCSGDDDRSSAATTTSQSSDSTPPSDEPIDEPIDLMKVAEGTTLEGGTYAIGLLHADGTERVVIDVPAGYVGGGPVIGSPNGDAAFWGSVTTIDTDPCLRGRHVDAGTSVRDLVSALAAQRHMTTSRPVPVSVGGYHGLYLTLTAPADISRCRGGSVTIYGADNGPWLQNDVPRGVFHEWILNVRGSRVVGGVRIMPAADESGLTGIIESATFPAASG
jgi:hypothetical protein